MNFPIYIYRCRAYQELLDLGTKRFRKKGEKKWVGYTFPSMCYESTTAGKTVPKYVSNKMVQTEPEEKQEKEESTGARRKPRWLDCPQTPLREDAKKTQTGCYPLASRSLPSPYPSTPPGNLARKSNRYVPNPMTPETPSSGEKTSEESQPKTSTQKSPEMSKASVSRNLEDSLSSVSKSSVEAAKGAPSKRGILPPGVSKGDLEAYYKRHAERVKLFKELETQEEEERVNHEKNKAQGIFHQCPRLNWNFRKASGNSTDTDVVTSFEISSTFSCNSTCECHRQERILKDMETSIDSNQSDSRYNSSKTPQSSFLQTNSEKSVISESATKESVPEDTLPEVSASYDENSPPSLPTQYQPKYYTAIPPKEEVVTATATSTPTSATPMPTATATPTEHEGREESPGQKIYRHLKEVNEKDADLDPNLVPQSVTISYSPTHGVSFNTPSPEHFELPLTDESELESPNASVGHANKDSLEKDSVEKDKADMKKSGALTDNLFSTEEVEEATKNAKSNEKEAVAKPLQTQKSSPKRPHSSPLEDSSKAKKADVELVEPMSSPKRLHSSPLEASSKAKRA